MAIVSMKELLEAGVHFGHQTRKWNPKMATYIFGERNGIYIIDLQQTIKYLQNTYKYVKSLSEEGKTVLFVSTKRQARKTIEEEAKKCNMPYVCERWLGGMLTNWNTISKRIKFLKRIEEQKENGFYEKITKKEANKLEKKRIKLENFLGGIKNMEKIPDAIFVVDPGKEVIGVKEAKKLNIPIIAMVDTNCDPDLIDHIIPSNDDAIRAVKLITGVISRGVRDGRMVYEKELIEAQEAAEAEKVAAEAAETEKVETADTTEAEKVQNEESKAVIEEVKVEKTVEAVAE